MTVLDLFAGPGGWDEGASWLGIKTVGVEWDDAACRTAKAAGHTRVRADVETLPTQPMAGKVTGLIASPPCQDFSLAGKRAGIEGEKGRLITQVLRWTNDLRPRWVACEQVPPCLELWEQYAEVMRGWGYRTWTGVLNAADYGVPQTRKRAILLASLDRQPHRPEPTHARGGDVDLFGSRAPWVSMAEALGWGFDAPSATVSGGGTESGGAEPFGNANYRRRLLQFVSAGMTGEGRPKDPHQQPADTLTGKGTAYWITDEQREVWGDRPATTVVGSFRPDVIATPGYRTAEDGPRQNAPGSVRVSVQEAAVLQSFPADYPWQGSRTKQFQQVGNAVPPRLAAHVLAAVLDRPLPRLSKPLQPDLFGLDP